MATVYLARFVGVAGFKRFVAIKRLHPHLAKEHEFIQMFLDEARLAARLHHPNVVPILEIGVQQNEQYYVVMEYIEGATAGHLLACAAHTNRKIPVAIAIRIMLDALTGLHAAHDLADEDGIPLDIVHRDVSPQNILVGIDGVARITDFGVAKAATRLANATQGGQLKGKLAYMSPEQVRGNLPVDRRADIFAAGIVLWEMLTGYRLFKADGEAETLFKVVAAEVPSIRAYEPSVPPEVEVVVTRALAREADQRFRTAADFAEALEQAARVYDLVATVRTAAAFVNEMIGLDISQQRDIVRAWLARSDVSKSGVARSQALQQAGIHDPAPQSQSQSRPQPAPQQPELSSLVDDDLDMATRVDDPDQEDPNDATRIQQLVPQASPSAPVVMERSSHDPAYFSYPTTPEFQPMGVPMAPANNPALVATVNAPFAPLGAAASGPWPAPPAAFPTPPVPTQKATLPLWTMAIPAVIIIGGAVLLGLHARSSQQASSPPPKSALSTTATPASQTPPQTPPQQPSAMVTPEQTVTLPLQPPPTTSAPQPGETAATIVAPTPTRPPTVWRGGGGAATTKKTPATVDNKEFGGRK